jgi:hypothetical protein
MMNYCYGQILTAHYERGHPRSEESYWFHSRIQSINQTNNQSINQASKQLNNYTDVYVRTGTRPKSQFAIDCFNRNLTVQ